MSFFYAPILLLYCSLSLFLGIILSRHQSRSKKRTWTRIGIRVLEESWWLLDVKDKVAAIGLIHTCIFHFLVHELGSTFYWFSLIYGSYLSSIHFIGSLACIYGSCLSSILRRLHVYLWIFHFLLLLASLNKESSWTRYYVCVVFYLSLSCLGCIYSPWLLSFKENCLWCLGIVFILSPQITWKRPLFLGVMFSFTLAIYIFLVSLYL